MERPDIASGVSLLRTYDYLVPEAHYLLWLFGEVPAE
jgi:hypothetical protein